MRYYDPSIGRFLSEDTYWNPANMTYGDDPITWNEREDDPLGLNTYTYVPDMSAIMQSGNRYVYGLNKLTYRKNNTVSKPCPTGILRDSLHTINYNKYCMR